MKLPDEVKDNFPVLIGSVDWVRYEALVRDCAKVCLDEVMLCPEDEAWDNTKARKIGEGTSFNLAVQHCIKAILARYGLEPQEKQT